MAAGTLPSPGKVVNGEEIGPCVGGCEHKDCAQTREGAASPCWVCGGPIGYEHPFVQRNGWKELAHEVCARREAREERGKR